MMIEMLKRIKCSWITDESIIIALAFSPNGEYLAIAGLDSIARIWQVKTGVQVCSVSHEDIITAISFSPDGQYMATASEDGTAQIWQVLTGRRVACLPHKESVRYVSFTDKGSCIVTLTGSRIFPNGNYSTGKVTAWEVRTGNKILQIVNRAGIETISLEGQGKYFVLADKENKVQLCSRNLLNNVLSIKKSQIHSTWKVPENPVISCMRGKAPIKEIALSANGKYVATINPGGTVQVWQLPEGLAIAQISHQEAVNSVRFCPKGEYIVTTSDDHTARVWDVQSSQALAHFVHNDVVNIAIFSPKGNLIATAAGDPMSDKPGPEGVRLWPWNPGAL
jgi:WD40 repeat protein